MIWMALILTFSILIQTWHWYRIFQPPKQQKHLIFSHTPKIFISVIICFHRPWTSIPRVLKRLCEQTYPHFEVLLINDGPVKLQPSHLDWIQQQSKFKYIIHNKKRPGKKDRSEERRVGKESRNQWETESNKREKKYEK